MSILYWSHDIKMNTMEHQTSQYPILWKYGAVINIGISAVPQKYMRAMYKIFYYLHLESKKKQVTLN